MTLYGMMNSKQNSPIVVEVILVTEDNFKKITILKLAHSAFFTKRIYLIMFLNLP